MRRSATLVPAAALVIALGGCGGSISGNMGDPTVVPVQWQFGGLVALPSLPSLPQQHAVVPYAGYPGSAFHLGAFVDDSAWRAFAASALIEGAPAIGAGQAVIFAVLDAQTNALAPARVERQGAELSFTVAWEGIEPHYATSTPAALVLIDKAGIVGVRVRASMDREIGSFPMP
jgi:hypothetical protein